LVYDPVGCSTGQGLFTYTIEDGGGLTDSATVVISLTKPSGYPMADGPKPAFRTGTTIGKTIPVKMRWCGLAGGATIKNWRLWQSRNDGAYDRIIKVTTATSSTRSLSPARYHFKARIKDSKSRVSYGVGPDFRLARIQNTSSALSYSSGWSVKKSSSHSGGSVTGTSTKGKSVSYTYTGRAFAIVGPRGSTRGAFKVFVDGVKVAKVSERASRTQYRRVLYARNLVSGTHTIRIVAAGGGRIDLDAILTLGGY